MNLLPKSKDDFRTVTYWEEFFKKRKNAFEWYGDYAELGCILDKYMKPSDAILMPGCGSSKLSEDLYDNGYRDITNIDLSETVVRQVVARNSAKRPQMKTLKMDMTKMDFAEESFSVIVDKASLDAIFTDENQEVLLSVHKYFGEIDRMLRPGGRFICISLAQKHICQGILTFFQDKWIIRIHCIKKDVSKDAGLGSRLPTFIFVMTKMKIKLAKPMIEVASTDETKPAKVTLDQALSTVLGMQEYSIVEHRLASSSLAEQLTVDLWSDNANQTSPRYSITVVDSPSSRASQGQFGVFIVPQGRETEWLFSTEKGRQKLANAADFKRLAVVTLHRGHIYQDLDQVKAELSQHVMQLAPQGVSYSHKTPFLTTSDNVGWREVIHEGSSSTGGGFAVEDVLTEDGQYFRRLILKGFASSIQSEARLVAPKKSKKKKVTDIRLLSWKERKIDSNYLDPLYQAMVSALSFTDVSADDDRHVLLIGLGGGSMARFLNRALPHCHFTCVELEGEIIESAKTWFAIVESDHLRAVEDDGMAFMQRQVREGVKHKYQSIIVDVNASDQGDGIVGPPLAFRDHQAVSVYSTLLRPNGALLLNLVTRSEEAMREVVEELKDAFLTVYQCEIEDHVNRILVAIGIAGFSSQSQISASSSALHDVFNRNLSGQLDFNVSEISAQYQQL